MSDYQQKDNSGTLFTNDYKKAENHPDFKGKCKVNGKDMEFAAWKREGTRGEYLSISFSEPYKKNNADSPAPKTGSFKKEFPVVNLNGDDIDDGLPF